MTTTPKPRKRRSGPNSMGETMSSWEALSTTAKSHLADNPQAAANQAAFEALIAQIKAANAEQEGLNARLRDSIHSRQEMQKQGRSLRNHLASHLRSKLGPESDLLREFGIPPLGRRVRRKSPAGAPTSTPPPTGGGPESQKP
ncbi:MAG: hypothetical protein QOJ16_2408 [Acidobacteriota bacterium]|jgi:hypothetical protein|nr:hypothetical protein [Acidobacteriota bacterium]